MINQNDQLHLHLTLNLNRNLQNYVHSMGIKTKINWELRTNQQFVSNCFPQSTKTQMEAIQTILEQSGMFLQVKMFKSQKQPDQLRLVINIENIAHLADQFNHAQYLNALLKILPVTGLICLPVSLKDQLTVKTCSSKNSYEVVPDLLKLLNIQYDIATSNQISFSCRSVKKLINIQKEIGLNYLIQIVKEIDKSVNIYHTSTNVQHLASGRGGVKTINSKNFWEACPAITFEYNKSNKTYERLNNINPDFFEVKISGYYIDEEPLIPCGIKLKSVLNIPFFIKDIVRSDIHKIRKNYLNCLCTFKSKTKEFGFAALPYEISKKILLLADDKSLLSENEKSELIDTIRGKFI